MEDTKVELIKSIMKCDVKHYCPKNKSETKPYCTPCLNIRYELASNRGRN